MPPTPTTMSATPAPPTPTTMSATPAERENVRVVVRLKGGTEEQAEREPCAQIHLEDDRAVLCRHRMFRWASVIHL